MTCEQIQPLLPDYALDLLDDPQAAAVAAHLASPCAACQTQLDELREATTLLTHLDEFAATPLLPPPELKQQLLERIGATTEVQTHEVHRAEPGSLSSAPSGPKRRWYWLAYAAAACVAFVVGAQIDWRGSSSSTSPPPLTQQEREQLYRDRMAQIEQSFDATQMRLATLSPADGGSSRQGAVLWDKPAGQVHLFAIGTPPASPGHVLQIWLVDEAGVYTQAGVLSADDTGEVATAVEVPAGVDSLDQLVVTEEPADSSATAPTGPTRLVGHFE